MACQWGQAEVCYIYFAGELYPFHPLLRHSEALIWSDAASEVRETSQNDVVSKALRWMSFSESSRRMRLKQNTQLPLICMSLLGSNTLHQS